MPMLVNMAINDACEKHLTDKNETFSGAIKVN